MPYRFNHNAITSVGRSLGFSLVQVEKFSKC
jgi:hypothetical protein